MPLTYEPEIFDLTLHIKDRIAIPTIHWQYINSNRRYAVQICMQSPNQEDTTIYQEANLCCKGIQHGKPLWQLSKENIYINNLRTENPLEMLAIALAGTYYPIDATIKKEGGIETIHNLSSLQKRFEDAKPNLLRDFDGDFAKDVIADIAYALQDSETFRKVLDDDIWVSLFFAPLAGAYDTLSASKEILLNIPVSFFEHSLKFICSATIQKNNIPADHIVVALSGNINNLEHIDTTGTLEVFYELNVAGHGIRNITCNITVNNAGETHLIFVKGYLLNETQIIKPDFLKPNSLEGDKKSFWNFLGF